MVYHNLSVAVGVPLATVSYAASIPEDVLPHKVSCHLGKRVIQWVLDVAQAYSVSVSHK